jgi:drug/metabolite transporter (DMT)-like permease
VVGAGILDVTANALYLLAVREGLLSLVAVLSSLYPVATVVLARFVLGERLQPAQLAGLGLGLAGVTMIAAA